MPEIFISYAWGAATDEKEAMADQIEAALKARGLDLVRDKTGGLGYKGNIKQFMQQIGQGKAVICLISDKYLRSPNCMFELLEIAKNPNFYDRIFPVVLSDANIYDPLGRIGYIQYWDGKIDQLNEAMKQLESQADLHGIREDIDLYTDIRGEIGRLTDTLRNMNTLTPEIHSRSGFEELYRAIVGKLQTEAAPAEPTTAAAPSQPKRRKQGKILYHIPTTMQVQQWTRCVVRLAFEEILLKEELNVPLEQSAIESIRIGKVMQVMMEEGRNGENFEIDPISEQEQIIFEDDFTEWLFDVKPLAEGTFRLVLKVILIQIVEGYGERKKEVVLEREVQTVAQNSSALREEDSAATEELPPPSPRVTQQQQPNGGTAPDFKQADMLVSLGGAQPPSPAAPAPLTNQPQPGVGTDGESFYARLSKQKEQDGSVDTQLQVHKTRRQRKRIPSYEQQQQQQMPQPQQPAPLNPDPPKSKSIWRNLTAAASLAVLMVFGWIAIQDNSETIKHQPSFEQLEEEGISEPGDGEQMDDSLKIEGPARKRRDE